MAQNFEIDLSGLAAGIAKIQGEVDRRLTEGLKETKNYLTDQASENAPVDTGALQGDIRGSAYKEDGSYYVSIFINGNAPSSTYAVKMHEEDYKLGPDSRAKQAKNGHIVGPKYIQRAFTDNLTVIAEILTEYFK